MDLQSLQSLQKFRLQLLCKKLKIKYYSNKNKQDLIHMISTKYINQSYKNHHGEQCCQICLCDYQDGDDVRVLGCHHIFHTECVNRWLDQKTNCPTCRRHNEYYINDVKLWGIISIIFSYIYILFMMNIFHYTQQKDII